MSVSTDGILFYGYCWQEEGDGPQGDEEEWVEQIAKARGYVDPWASFVTSTASSYSERRAEDDQWVKDNRAKLDLWSQVRKNIREEFGVELGSHCSGEFPIPFLAIESTVKRASRGYPVQIFEGDVFGASMDDDHYDKLEEWFKVTGVTKPQETPSWWLVSMWS